MMLGDESPDAKDKSPGKLDGWWGPRFETKKQGWISERVLILCGFGFCSMMILIKKQEGLWKIRNEVFGV